MREDPIISGGVFKILLVLLVALGLGAGAWAITGGVDIDLPDLPDVDTTGDEVVNIDQGDFSDTTIGAETTPAPEGEEDSPAQPDTFTTASFSSALDAVRSEVGPGRQLTRLFINDVQTQFIVRTGGDGVEAWSVMGDDGELIRQDATVTFSGNATIDDFSFALDGVQAGAVDRMIAQARKESGASDFRPTVLSLERRIPFGDRRLSWTINAQGNGRSLLYRANADGRKVRDEAGGGTEIPPAVLEAQKLNDCIRAASGDPDEVVACFERFQIGP